MSNAVMKHKRIYEIYPSCTELDKTNQDIIYRIINIDASVYEEIKPDETVGFIRNWFNLYRNGKKIWKYMDDEEEFHGIKRKNVLMQNESLTFFFKLSDIIMGPSLYPGKYLICAKKNITDMACPKLPVKGVTRNAGFIFSEKAKHKIESCKIKELNHAEMEALIKADEMPPFDKFLILQAAIDNNKKDIFWGLIFKCNEPYAVIKALDNLPRTFIEKDFLFNLLQFKDVSIRRHTVIHFARLGKDENTAEQLENYLKTVQDEPTLRYYAKDIVNVLRGEKHAVFAHRLYEFTDWDKDDYWRLVLTCAQEGATPVYALLHLMYINRALIDKNKLFNLIFSTKNYTVLEEAIRYFAYLGKDTDVAERLEKFLQQFKEYKSILDAGNKTLKVLRGEEM